MIMLYRLRLILSSYVMPTYSPLHTYLPSDRICVKEEKLGGWEEEKKGMSPSDKRQEE